MHIAGDRDLEDGCTTLNGHDKAPARAARQVAYSSIFLVSHSRISIVQRLALVDSPRVRTPLPRAVIRRLELRDRARQLVESRMVDN